MTCWPFLANRCLIISPFLPASLLAAASHPLWAAPFISLYTVISVVQHAGYAQILLSYNLWCVRGFLYRTVCANLDRYRLSIDNKFSWEDLSMRRGIPQLHPLSQSLRLKFSKPIKDSSFLMAAWKGVIEHLEVQLTLFDFGCLSGSEATVTGTSRSPWLYLGVGCLF